MRTAARVDQNQAAIIAALRRVGATVCILSSVGHGCPDLLVGYKGKNYLLEVKAKTGRLTRHQIAWINAWAGQVQVLKPSTGAYALLEITT